MRMWITEIKHHLNKPVERYRCRLVHDRPGYRVISYCTDRDYDPGPAKIPKGSLTIGHYWTDRGYVLWALSDPDGALIGHWFHLCEAVLIGEDFIEYLDLLLDLWLYPDGSFVELDRDEMDACLREGKLSAQQVVWIERWAGIVRRETVDILGTVWRPIEKDGQV